jgi:transcriptional regulator with XRE-family HTH domain
MSIGANIKKIRYKNDYSQETLADLLGVSQGTLSNIESDKSSPDFDLLQKIASSLNVSIVDLLDNTKIILNEVENNHGVVQNSGTVNLISEKLIEQYEIRLSEKDKIIANLRTKVRLIFICGCVAELRSITG